ncbi:MAG: ANTAR domain-containing protein [Oryzihumus sp.]
MDDAEHLLETSRRAAASLVPGDLDATLKAVTAAAVAVLPSVHYASITVLHDHERMDTVAPTDDLLRDLDAAQSRLREGPCFTGAKDEVPAISADLATDPRFPGYGPHAAAAGIRSQAGLPLFDARGSQGALNLYSRDPGAFDDSRTLASLFTHQAAVAIAYAREVDDLRTALSTRETIGRAVGVVMERYGLSHERAFAYLARISQNRNERLAAVAERVLAGDLDD